MNPPPLRSTALRVRLARFPSPPALPAAAARPLRARQIKTHTGCQQCKRRKIKCDETKPICRRCQARGDHCSQPARPEQWQTVVLRPVAQPSTHLSDDDLLQYFAAVMLKDMVVDVKTAAPLRQALDPLIQRSKALLYSVRSLTQIHRNRFDPASMHAPLQDRQRAVVALRQEVQQELVDALQSRSALNRLLLASLFLTILHAWCDAPHENGALLHLRGATATVDLLLAPQYRDPRTVVLQDFLVGTVAFLDMMYAFLIPASNPLPQSSRMLDMLKQDRWRSGTYIHPVSGLATPLIMLVAQTGRYYRSVVDLRIRDPRREHELERSLLAWQPLDADDKTLYVRVADAYRVCGLILLQQARRVTGANPPAAPADTQEQSIFSLTVFALAILRDSPRVFPHPTFETPLLLAIGPEIDSDNEAGRALVEDRLANLYDFMHGSTHKLVTDFVRETWRLRDEGSNITWLEHMVEKGWSPLLL